MWSEYENLIEHLTRCQLGGRCRRRLAITYHQLRHLFLQAKTKFQHTISNRVDDVHDRRPTDYLPRSIQDHIL